MVAKGGQTVLPLRAGSIGHRETFSNGMYKILNVFFLIIEMTPEFLPGSVKENLRYLWAERDEFLLHAVALPG